ncbi:MAG: hypothetical protein Ct9H300mP1_26100 [Planctomycetaceae bacterium]|nr:MAG: hypothetical protein Ct9H300mP1_26100 [Planctomycetaceae bacterium]
MLIVTCDGFTRPFYDRLRRWGVPSPQFVVALDRRTGQPRWRKPRANGRHSYSTPMALDPAPGRQVISAGGDRVVSYDPTSGRELWWVRYTGYSVVPRPVAGPPGRGLIYVCTGYDNPRLLAIRTGGSGDVTGTHVAWQHAKAIPLNPTPLQVEDALYLINDSGIASCLDARNGISAGAAASADTSRLLPCWSTATSWPSTKPAPRTCWPPGPQVPPPGSQPAQGTHAGHAGPSRATAC